MFKGGVFNRVIDSSTENDGHASWPVPADQTPGTDYKIKITTISSSLITDTSDDYFTIHEPGTITLTSPIGGEKWVRGTTHAITWSTAGYIGTTIDIELFKGGSYVCIVRLSAENTGYFSWFISADQTVGADYKIKITSTGFDMVDGFSDISDGPFEITAGTLTVNSPNGGESWARGSENLISWSSSGNTEDYVLIKVIKSGTSERTLVLTSNDGSYNWAIPADEELGTDYSIRIEIFGDPSIFDASDGYFTVAGIDVANPTGGESWMRSGTYIVAWSFVGNVGDYVKIELLKGGVLNKVISSSTANDYGAEYTEYFWTIDPLQAVGTDYSIRVTSTSNSVFTDTSDANFEITLNSLSVLAPNGGENWARGTTNTITWSDSGSGVSFVKIELYKSGVLSSVISSSTDNDGTFYWSTPAGQEAGSDYQIKITAISKEWFNDVSDGNFAISGITVATPNGGDFWVRGTTRTVFWSSVGSVGSTVKIELLKGGIPSIIASSTADTGSYSWAIPAGQELGTDYKIRVTSNMYSWIYDSSDNSFEIMPSSIYVKSPNGGESWARDITHTIIWSSEPHSSTVDIDLYRGGLFYSAIASTTFNDGYYDWLIPASLPVGSNYQVKITSNTGSWWYDLSDSYFNIIGIDVISPNGGEKLARGNAYTITWSSVGSVGSNVKIELLQGSTVIYDEITPNDGSFLVTIPVLAPVGTNYRIRITSTSYPTISDTSDGYFAII